MKLSVQTPSRFSQGKHAFKIKMMASRLVKGYCVAVLLAFGSLGVADEPAGATSEVIAENEIGALQKSLADAGEASSSIRKRRA